jgi:hypothetical protein
MARELDNPQTGDPRRCGQIQRRNRARFRGEENARTQGASRGRRQLHPQSMSWIFLPRGQCEAPSAPTRRQSNGGSRRQHSAPLMLWPFEHTRQYYRGTQCASRTAMVQTHPDELRGHSRRTVSVERRVRQKYRRRRFMDVECLQNVIGFILPTRWRLVEPRLSQIFGAAPQRHRCRVVWIGGDESTSTPRLRVVQPGHGSSLRVAVDRCLTLPGINTQIYLSRRCEIILYGPSSALDARISGLARRHWVARLSSGTGFENHGRVVRSCDIRSA